MSTFLSEDVIEVPPLSLREIERRAGEVRGLLAALAGTTNPALPWAELVDRHLPRAGLLFYPASEAELRDCEAATDPSGDGAIHILMRPELYESLTDAGPRGNRARATAAHELGHAVLHVPYIRKQRGLGREKALVRVARARLEAFRDPEWQAWAFAGCLLIPRASIQALGDCSPAEISRIHGVSAQFTAAHMARLKLPPPQPSRAPLGASLLLARRAQTTNAKSHRARQIP